MPQPIATSRLSRLRQPMSHPVKRAAAEQQQQAGPVRRRRQREPAGDTGTERDRKPQPDPLAFGLQPYLDRFEKPTTPANGC